MSVFRKHLPYLLTLLCFYAQSAWCFSVIDLQTTAKKEHKALKIKGLTIRQTLINLNPAINSWFLYAYRASKKSVVYHLENPQPTKQMITLSKKPDLYLEITKNGQMFACDITPERIAERVSQAEKSGESYIPLCDNRIYIRGHVKGRQSTKEMIAGFLRSYIWHGEEVTSLIKETLLKDKYLIDSETSTLKEVTLSSNVTGDLPPSCYEKCTNVENTINLQNTLDQQPQPLEPISAKIAENPEKIGLENNFLGISVKGFNGEQLEVGKWYQANLSEGVWVSAIKPSFIDKNLLTSYTDKVSSLDSVEERATATLIAFDLENFSLGYGIGTESPSVEWSDRSLAAEKSKRPGPDGIGTIKPLVGTGRIPPYLLTRMVATFAAGFKRNHSAFKWGPLSRINNGSHYGFIEHGVVLSKLQPNLATLIITQDDSIVMKTWAEEDNEALLGKIKHARQNGVPLVNGIDSKDIPIPGEFVKMWGEGNWSGSIDNKQRALRAGICLQKKDGRNFLIFGYFSSATPNAMARVFQSYSCDYALHLDMNALEHTYLGLYSRGDRPFKIEYLIKGMEVLDYDTSELTLARFLHFSDNRDFFYVYRKDE